MTNGKKDKTYRKNPCEVYGHKEASFTGSDTVQDFCLWPIKQHANTKKKLSQISKHLTGHIQIPHLQ